MMDEAVTFKNKKGQKLFGIVHIPDKSRFSDRKIGVNLLNPGIKYRVAPHRLNVKLARKLCEQGYYVLRFDPEGIGDSEGELPEGMPIADVWGKIQTGLFVEDTVIANDFFIEKYDINELILIGNCGGAITSLLTSREDQRINALCLIDTPVYLWNSKMSFADTIIKGGDKADRLFSEYLKKIFNLKTWYNFCTLKSDYKTAWKVSKIKFQEKIIPLLKNNGSKKIEELCSEKNLNIQFFKSFDSFISKKKPILFISAGNDPGIETFQNYFQNSYLKKRFQDNRHEKTDFYFIENANHIYTLTEWQERLISKISEWILDKVL